MIRVAIYNECVHENESDAVRKIYPDGIHNCLKKALECDDISITTYTIDTVEEITEEALAGTDVLIWWGHVAHNRVPDEVARCVAEAVLGGMGAIFLHSAHHSKPFKLLMGTQCNLTWRENGDRELIWNIKPAHPITQGIGRFIKLDHEETYGEPFTIPEPDELVFISSYEGGEVFRSGCTYKRENGKIFYFQPGHETFPTFYNEEIIKVIKNAIYWAKPIYRAKIGCPKVEKPI